MPVISMFYGIIVLMYFRDSGTHKLPHIHVEYAERSAVISIPDGQLLEGSLPAGKLRLVQAWIELHQDELLADWKLAVQGMGIYKIEPLR